MSLRPVDALATVIASMRPDWRADAITQALRYDTRPWAQVCESSVLAALNTDIRHPQAMRTYAGQAASTWSPPPVREALGRWDAVHPDRATAHVTAIRDNLRTKAQEPSGDTEPPSVGDCPCGDDYESGGPA